MPWITTVAPEDAEGLLKEAYDWQASRLGFPGEFTQLGSLSPEIVQVRLQLYKATENVKSSLTSRQRNIVSYVVSTTNRTPFCESQSRVKLRELGLSAEEFDIISRRAFDELPPIEAALARYASKLTLDPGSIDAQDIQALRDVGLDDLDILDANNLTAHLNYTNRVANGLGLLHEIDADVYDPFRAIPE